MFCCLRYDLVKFSFKHKYHIAYFSEVYKDREVIKALIILQRAKYFYADEISF